MGCDGYLKKPRLPKNVILRCYSCGQTINLTNPIKGHEDCTDIWNGEEILKIDLEIDDYEER